MKQVISMTLAALFLFGQAAFAGVAYNPETKVLTIEGKTDAALWRDVASGVANNADIVSVHMSGPGGYLGYGLAIGDLLHDLGVPVIVPEKKQCISACAIAAMAAPRIVVDGQLWFHGPYFPNVPSDWSFQKYGNALSSANIDVALRFAKWGFPIALWQDIVERTTACVFIVVNDVHAGALNALRNEDMLAAYVPLVGVESDFCTGELGA